MELKNGKLHSPLLLPTFKVSTAHLGVSLDYTLHCVKSVVELDEDESSGCSAYCMSSAFCLSRRDVKVFLTTRNVEI
jgi:hypothetical protein